MRSLRRGTAVKYVASLLLEAEAQADGRLAQQQAFDRALRREGEGALELVNAATNAALDNFNACNQSYWNTENLSATNRAGTIQCGQSELLEPI
jgi:hypothetical protein